MAKTKKLLERSMWYDMFEQDEIQYRLRLDDEYWYNQSKNLPKNDKHQEVQPTKNY